MYVDPSNPKVNRNIVQSKLFAADYILRDIIAPVSTDEIEDFYNHKDEITTCKIKGAEITDCLLYTSVGCRSLKYARRASVALQFRVT